VKTCFKCKRELPRSEFYAHPEMKDGLLGKCKDCARDDVTEHRIKNIGRIREYDRNRASQPQRAVLRDAVTRRDRATFPERYRARMAVARALKAGVLMKPEACQRCGNTPSRIEAHHADYGAPLDVEWLCKPCHYIADKERRAA
jgi:ribosomal protein S27AE